jgi:hypothetical protein
MIDARRDWSFASDLGAAGVQWLQRWDIAGHGDDVLASLQPSRGLDGDDRQMLLTVEGADLEQHFRAAPGALYWFSDLFSGTMAMIGGTKRTEGRQG